MKTIKNNENNIIKKTKKKFEKRSRNIILHK